MIEAITVLDVTMLSPVRIDLGRDGRLVERVVRQQDEILVRYEIMRHLDPQRLVGLAQSDLEPAKALAHTARFEGMGQLDLWLKLEGYIRDLVKPRFRFPPLAMRVVDFDLTIVSGPGHKLAVHSGHLGKGFLIVQAGVADKAQFRPRK